MSRLRSTVVFGFRTRTLDFHLEKPRLRAAINSLRSLWPDPLDIRVGIFHVIVFSFSLLVGKEKIRYLDFYQAGRSSAIDHQ